MNSETINMIIKCLVTVLGCVLTTIVIPYVKSMLDASKLAKIEEYTELAVRCAEMIYTPEQWSEKKAYVMDYILRKSNDIGASLTYDDINNMVEGIVQEVKKACTM